jgi:hypothetical protein
MTIKLSQWSKWYIGEITILFSWIWLVSFPFIIGIIIFLTQIFIGIAITQKYKTSISGKELK